MSTPKKMWFACGYNQCTRVFKAEGLLERHASTHRTFTSKIVNSERRFKCEICPASFDQSNNLITHIYSHTGEKPFKCDYQDCSMKFSQKASMYRHITSMHLNPNAFKCLQCSKTFSHKQSYLQHVRTHTGEKPYTCSYCNYRCSVRSSMAQHAKYNHKDEKLVQKDPPPKCKRVVFAEKVMVKLTRLSQEQLSTLMLPKSKKKLNMEPKKLKPQLKLYPCGLCDKSFSSYQQKYKHKKTDCKKVSTPKFPCGTCKKTFKTYQQLGGHMKGHRKSNFEKALTLLPKTSQESEDCKIIPNKCISVEPPKVFTCDMCDKTFKSSNLLGTHKKIHKWQEPAKPFPCSHCSMSYSFKSYLDLHMMSHRNSETPMQTEANDTNLLSLDDESANQISDFDFSEIGSENLDLDSRISDIESVGSPHEHDDILENESHWPEAETVVVDPIKGTDDALKCSTNIASNLDTRSLDDTEIIYDRESPITNDEKMQGIDLVLEDIKNDCVSQNYSLPSRGDLELGDCNNTATDEKTVNGKNSIEEDCNRVVVPKQEKEVLERISSEDFFAVIDENNDFYKAILPISNCEKKENDFACKDCGKKSRDQYSLYRHMQTWHRSGSQREPKGRSFVRQKIGETGTPNGVLNTNFTNTPASDELNETSCNPETAEAPIIKVQQSNDDTFKLNVKNCNISKKRKKQKIISSSITKKKISGKSFKPYSCSCKKKFVREKSLNKHLHLHVNSNPIHIQVYNPQPYLNLQERKINLVQAEKVAENGQNVNQVTIPECFSCGLCKQVYSCHEVLLRHIRLVHKQKGNAADIIVKRLIRHPDKVKKYNCSFCDTVFLRYGNLARHMEIIHGSCKKLVNQHDKSLTNIQPKKLFTESNEIPKLKKKLTFAKKSGQKLQKSREKSKPKMKISVLPECNNLPGIEEKIEGEIAPELSLGESPKKPVMIFHRKNNNFNQNISETTTGKRSKKNACNSCSKIFVSTYHLDMHKKMKHPQPKILKLINHRDKKKPMKAAKKKVHNNTFICPHNHCGRKFSSQVPLSYHMLMHTESEDLETPSKLEDSNKPSTVPSTGIRTETSRANNTCSICNKKFVNTFSLDRHMNNKLIHTPGYRHAKKTGYNIRPQTKLIQAASYIGRATRTLVSQKLKQLAEIHCIPCSVYLESTLILTS